MTRVIIVDRAEDAAESIPVPAGGLPDGQLEVYRAGSVRQAEAMAAEFEKFDMYLKEKFWQDVIFGTTGDAEAAAERIHMEPQELAVLPVLIEIKEWQPGMPLRGRAGALSSLKELASGIFTEGRGVVLQIMDDILVVLCDPDTGPARLTDRCLSFIDECAASFSASACCCIGERVCAGGLEEMLERMMSISRENITGEKLLLLRFGVSGKSAPIREPDLAVWKNMLLAGEYDPMLISVTDYFFQAAAANRLSFENLRRFSHDFQQIMHVVLQEKGVAAHVIFDNEKGDELWADAADSLSGLFDWIFWSVVEISKYLGAAGSRRDKLGVITEYIRNNLDRELSRRELASQVHLSGSALARMFKDGTGMTLTKYIFSQRLDAARQLLRTTSMPIGEAAEKCGFRNYSYFYTRFKEAEGVSPSEYRRNSRAGDIE